MRSNTKIRKIFHAPATTTHRSFSHSIRFFHLQIETQKLGGEWRVCLCVCVHCARVDVVHSIKSNRFAINNIILNAINEECETCVLEHIHRCYFCRAIIIGRVHWHLCPLQPLPATHCVRVWMCATMKNFYSHSSDSGQIGIFYFHFLSNFEQSHSPHLVARCVFAFATPSSFRLSVVSHENRSTNGTVFRSEKYEILSNFS